MNNYSVNEASIKNIDAYNEFLMQNPGKGNLKIRASAASGALPISNMQIVVSKVIGNDNIIFFEGATNESGLIEKIVLPAALLNQNNLDAPKSTTYDISASYNPGNIKLLYKVNMYDGVYVVQNINVNPNMNMLEGDASGR